MLSKLLIKHKDFGSYEIYFHSNWSNRNLLFFSSFIKKNAYESVFILTDKNVAKYHLQFLLDFLEKNKIRTNAFVVAGQEKNKNLKTCELVYKKMAELNLGRKSLFINLGGGVISDLGGFVASTYKRGIDFINMPTSLLAMVDASIGGKLGVDLSNNKNLVGLFANPKMVLINLDFLKTLPKREFLNGWAEIIKHGLISDRHYFDLVTSKNPLKFSNAELLGIVCKSCEIKYSFVEGDEYDLGKRQILNFGHTLGHALESYFMNSKKYDLKHGEAVIWGMLLEAAISNLAGVLSDREYLLIKERLISFGLIDLPFQQLNLAKLQRFLFNDKKNKNKSIIFNLIKKIGDIKYGQAMDMELLAKVLETFKGNYANYGKNQN